MTTRSKQFINLTATALLLNLPRLAYAVGNTGGLNKITTGLTTFETWFFGLGGVIFTIAILWQCYKIAFTEHGSFGALGKVVIVGVVAGASAEAGQYFFG